MSRIIRAALAVGATVAVLAGTATVVQADEGTDARSAAEAARVAAEKARKAAGDDDPAVAARDAAIVAAAMRSEAVSRAAMPHTVVQLTSANSGKCLDVEGAKTTNGIDVQQYTCNSTSAQKWNAVAKAGGSFELRSVLSGKCLEVERQGTKSGAVVQQWTCGEGEHQRWQMMLVDPVRKLYELQPMHADGMCLDVPGAKTDNGVNTQLYTCNRTAAQLWQVRPAA
ncbi:RICIN domain-containing protein [Streptomyces sp. NPDC001514]